MSKMSRPFQNPPMSSNSVPKSGASKKKSIAKKEIRPGKLTSLKNDRVVTGNVDHVKTNDKEIKKISEKRHKRKTRERSPIIIEDIIDGFGFTSFRTLEDLEDFANGVDLSVYDSPCSNSSYASTEIQSDDDSPRLSPEPGSSGMVPRASTPYATVESDLPGSPSSDSTIESFPVCGTPSATPLSELPGTPGRVECVTDTRLFDHHRNLESPVNMDRNKSTNKVKKDTKGKKPCNRSKPDYLHIMPKVESQENGLIESESESREEKSQEEQKTKGFVTVDSNQVKQQEERMDIASPVIDVSRERETPPLPQDNKPSFNHPMGSNAMKNDGFIPITPLDPKCSSPQQMNNTKSCNIPPKEEIHGVVSESNPCPKSEIDRQNQSPGHCAGNSVEKKDHPFTESKGSKATEQDTMSDNALKNTEIKMEVVDNFYPKCEAFRENNRLSQYSHKPYENSSNIQGYAAVKTEPVSCRGYTIQEDSNPTKMISVQSHRTSTPPQHCFRAEHLQQDMKNDIYRHRENYSTQQPIQSVHQDRSKKQEDLGTQQMYITGKQRNYSAADASVGYHPRQNVTSANPSTSHPHTGSHADLQPLDRPHPSQATDIFSRPLRPAIYNSSRFHSPVPTAAHHNTTSTVTVSTASPGIGSSPKVASVGGLPKSSPSVLNLQSSRTTSHHGNSKSSHPPVSREQPRPIPGLSGTRETQQPKPIPGISGTRPDYNLTPSFDQIGYQGSSSTYRGATSPYLPFRSSTTTTSSSAAHSTYSAHHHHHHSYSSHSNHNNTTTSSSKPALSSLHNIPVTSPQQPHPHHHGVQSSGQSASTPSSLHHHHLPLGGSTSTSSNTGSRPLSGHLNPLSLPLHRQHSTALISPTHTPTLSLPSALLPHQQHPNPPAVHHISPTLPPFSSPTLNPTLPPSLHTGGAGVSGSSVNLGITPPHAALGMFAPPLPLALSSAPVPLPSVPPFGGLDVLANSDLHRERERLIQERLGNALPPYIRAEMHSHNHQHVHQHNHNHTHLPSQQHPGGGINPLTPPTASLLTPSLSHLKNLPHPGPMDRPTLRALDKPPSQYDKLSSKLDGPFPYPGQAPVPSLPSYSTLGALSGLPPVVPPSSLGSGLQGAFQPKNLGSSSNMHPSQMLLSLRGDKAPPPTVANASPASATASAQPSTTSTTGKKPGKWCAAHVRIAWEIHMHQQKQKVEGSRSADASLVPPGHLVPPPPPSVGLHRPELASSLLGAGSHERSSLDPSHPSHPAASLLNPARLAGLSPFPRPSPFSLPSLGGAAAAFGAFSSLMPNGLYPSAHDPLSLSAGLGANPQEWNRLHRTPPSFPQPPSAAYAKAESDRENEREALLRQQRDGSREREALLRHQRDGSREREALLRHQRDGSREREAVQRDRELREKERDREYLITRHSPLRDHSGRSSLELERLRDKERAERNSRESFTERSRSRSPVRNGPLTLDSGLVKLDGSSHNSTPVLSNPSSKLKEDRKDGVVIMDDKSLVNGYKQDKLLASSLGSRTDHYYPSVSLGNPVDRGRFFPPYGSLWNYDVDRQRLDLQREFEKQKDSMLSRFTSVEREKLMEYERQKGIMQHMREAGGHHPASAALMHSNSSPHHLINNHSKPGISPPTTTGIPPPLIPTNSSSNSSSVHSHLSSSPVVINNKSKPNSPTQNNHHTESKEGKVSTQSAPTVNGLDQDGGAR